jgi:hypothetical protein
MAVASYSTSGSRVGVLPDFLPDFSQQPVDVFALLVLRYRSVQHEWQDGAQIDTSTNDTITAAFDDYNDRLRALRKAMAEFAPLTLVSAIDGVAFVEESLRYGFPESEHSDILARCLQVLRAQA